MDLCKVCIYLGSEDDESLDWVVNFELINYFEDGDEHHEEHNENDEHWSRFMEIFAFQLKNVKINKYILCVLPHHHFLIKN
jgi:hypothetical protein